MRLPRLGRLFCKGWTLPKLGNTNEQNEDAHRIRLPGEEGAETGLLVALSDGTSEAVYSGAWARHLVEHAGLDWPLLSDDEFRQRLMAARVAFSPLDPTSEPPWYVRNKLLSQGSQATLLAASLVEQEWGSATLYALAVGDTCLLHLKPSGEWLSFPVETSEEFGQQPGLVSTRPQHPLAAERFQTTVMTGDLLLFASDAVAQWALRCLEADPTLLFDNLLRLQGPESEMPPDECLEEEEEPTVEDRGFLRLLSFRPWRTREVDESNEVEADVAISLPDAFEAVVTSQRTGLSGPVMRNDDSTLLMVACLPEGEADLDDEIREMLEQLRALHERASAAGVAGNFSLRRSYKLAL